MEETESVPDSSNELELNLLEKLVDDAWETLQIYVHSLTDMAALGKEFIAVTNELNSLKQIRHQMSVRYKNKTVTRTHSAGPSSAIAFANNDRYAIIEDNIPDVLKCPVCMDVFGDQVIQCINGHSICSTCADCISKCPECRIIYRRGKIRNRALEELLRTLRLDCLYNNAGCTAKLVYSEMLGHVDNCPFMNKPVRSPEYIKTKIQVKTLNGQSRRLERRLKDMNERLIDSKAAWISAQNNLSDEKFSSVQDRLKKACEVFQLKQKEDEMTQIYVQLNKLVGV